MLRTHKTLSVTICILLFALTVQSQKRTVQWQNPPEDRSKSLSTDAKMKGVSQLDAIELLEVKVGNMTVNLGQSFIADDDWIKNLRFKIRNNSNSKITHVQISAFLPQLRVDNHAGPQAPFVFGSFVPDGPIIAPGKDFELPIAVYDWLLEQIKKTATLSEMNQIEIWDVSVTFENGSKIFSGCMKVVDSKNECPNFRE